MIRTRAMVQETSTKSNKKSNTGTIPASMNKQGIPARAIHETRGHNARTRTADNASKAAAATGRNRRLMRASKILRARTGTTETLIPSRNRPQ